LLQKVILQYKEIDKFQITSDCFVATNSVNHMPEKYISVINKGRMFREGEKKNLKKV